MNYTSFNALYTKNEITITNITRKKKNTSIPGLYLTMKYIPMTDIKAMNPIQKSFMFW